MQILKLVIFFPYQVASTFVFVLKYLKLLIIVILAYYFNLHLEKIAYRRQGTDKHLQGKYIVIVFNDVFLSPHILRLNPLINQPACNNVYLKTDRLKEIFCSMILKRHKDSITFGLLGHVDHKFKNKSSFIPEKCN